MFLIGLNVLLPLILAFLLPLLAVNHLKMQILVMVKQHVVLLDIAQVALVLTHTLVLRQDLVLLVHLVHLQM